MEYRWSIKDLKKIKRKLENAYRSSNSEAEKQQLLIDISDLKDAIENYTDQEKEYEEESIEEKLEFSQKILLPHFYTFEDCLNFDSITGYIDDYRELQKIEITQDDLLSITHDFYKDAIGGKLFVIFLKQFNMRNNHVRFSPPNKELQGQTLHIRQFDESFIEVQNVKNIIDLFTLIHEYGHAIHGSINHDQQYSMKFFPFIEFSSIFFELAAYEYFISKHFFIDETIKAKFITWQSFINRAVDLNPLIQMIQIKDYKNAKHLKRIIQNNYGFSSDVFTDLISSSTVMSYPYLYGAILAIELLDLYRKDRNLALNYLMQIMSSPAPTGEDLNNEILKLGIVPNCHVEEYESQMKRELTLLH